MPIRGWHPADQMEVGQGREVSSVAQESKKLSNITEKVYFCNFSLNLSPRPNSQCTGCTVFLMSLDISKEYDSCLLHRSESQTARCQEASCSFFGIRRWPGMLLSHSSIEYIFDWSTVKSMITLTPKSSHCTRFYSIETRPRESITSTSSPLPLQAQGFCCCGCLWGGVFCFVSFNFKSWARP